MDISKNSDILYEEKLLEQCNTEIYELEEQLKELEFFPEYDGIIVLKYIKCGKKGCRCSLDHDIRTLHGPYPHFQYRKNGVLHQKYLNRKNVREYKEKVDANSEYKKIKHLINEKKKEKRNLIKKIKEERQGE